MPFFCALVWYGLNERVPLLVITKTFLSLALQMHWARERKSDELAIAGSGAWRARGGRDIKRSDWHALCHPEPLRRPGRRVDRREAIILGFGRKLRRRLACPELGEGRASVFSPGEDGDLSTVALAKAEAGDVGFIVDTAGCSQADNPVAFVQSLLR